MNHQVEKVVKDFEEVKSYFVTLKMINERIIDYSFKNVTKDGK